MKSYAFIFARKNSKGLPGKNTKLLHGKPLIHYSIEVAFKTPGVKKVFVSTDDESVGKISRSLGATVIDRPIELARDDSPEWEAWKHAITWVQNRFGNFQEFISLPATSPLRDVKDIESAIIKKSYTGADICIAVTPASRNPYFNMIKKLNENFVELVNKPSKKFFRRQDIPEVFEITTVVYVANVDFILKNNNLFDGKVTSIEVPKNRAIDIDDIHDFNYAESILSYEVHKNN